MKTLIKNGLVVDGLLTKPYKSEVLIEDDKIVKIAKAIKDEADLVIDAKGRVVCPGFIDTHSHSDLMMLVNPYNYNRGSRTRWYLHGATSKRIY